MHHGSGIPECTELMSTDITSGTNGTILIVVYILAMIFIIVSNAMFIFGLWRTKKKRLFSTQLIFLVISCSDMMLGVVFIPFQLYFIVNIPDVLCRLSIARAFWSTFPMTFSGCLIMFLTFDRYSVVSKTTTSLSRSSINDKMVIVYIIFSLLASLGWSTWHIVITRMARRDPISTNQRLAIFFISIATFEFVVLGVSLVYNVLILRAVKKSNERSTISTALKRKSEHRLSNTILLIGSALILTYSPSVFATYVIGIILQQVERSQLLEKRDLVIQATRALIWSLILTLINSGLNATIFISRNSRIKKMYRSMYKCKARLQQGEIGMNSISSSPRITPAGTPKISIKNQNVVQH